MGVIQARTKVFQNIITVRWVFTVRSRVFNGYAFSDRLPQMQFSTGDVKLSQPYFWQVQKVISVYKPAFWVQCDSSIDYNEMVLFVDTGYQTHFCFAVALLLLRSNSRPSL